MKKLVSFLLCGFVFMEVFAVHAAVSVPETMTYQGTLYTSAGAPITTPHRIRFSIWNSGGIDGTTFLSDKVINTASPAFQDFIEEHVVTPNARGGFSVRLGQYTQLPTFEAGVHTHLQVEVKAEGTPDATYEVLDPDGIQQNGNDRRPITSVSYAHNAERVGNHAVGTGEGNIGVLGVDGKWTKEQIPDGTTEDGFTIDADDSADIVSLSFGESVAGELAFNKLEQAFSFSHDIDVAGHQIKNAVTHKGTVFPVAPVSGQQFYREDEGSLYVYNGTSWDSVSGDVTETKSDTLTLDADDTASTIGLQFGSLGALSFDRLASAFRLSGNLEVQGTIAQTGNELRLGTGNTGTGGIVQIIAEQGTNPNGIIRYDNLTRQWEVSNDGIYFQPMVTASGMYAKRRAQKEWVLMPEYPGYVLDADGTNNNGTMTSTFVDLGGIDKYAMYHWRTRQATLQDMDIVLRIPIPEDFGYFASNPLQIVYRTATDEVSDNDINISILDPQGTPISLHGANQLSSSSLGKAEISFEEDPSVSFGDMLLMRIRMSSKNGTFAEVGDITLRYVPW